MTRKPTAFAPGIGLAVWWGGLSATLLALGCAGPDYYPHAGDAFNVLPQLAGTEGSRRATVQQNEQEISAVTLSSARLGAPQAEAPGLPRKHVEEPKALYAAAALTLDQAINATLLADPKIRAGLEEINQAHADSLTASLTPNPELNADVQLLPLTRPFTVTEQGGPPQMDFLVGYPIDWFLFGKRAAAMASASLGVRVSEAEYADLVRRRVTEAALAFFDVLEARKLGELARQDLEIMRKLEAKARTGKAAGVQSEVELSRVRIEVLSSQKTLRDADAALLTAKAKLRALLGHGTNWDHDVAGTLDSPLTGDVVLVEEAYEEAVKNRPDLEALRLKAAQAQADIEVENRKAFPDVKPFVGYTRQFQTKAIGFPDANSWSGWIEMSLPFFNRNQGNRAKAASRAMQSNFEIQARLMELRSELEAAAQELRAARANAEPDAQEQLRLAEQIRDAVNQSYEKGQQSFADVLDAQRNYRETARASTTSLANYWRSLYRFNAAIGKQVCR